MSDAHPGTLFGFYTALSYLLAGDAVRRWAWPERTVLVYVPGSRITVERERPLGRALPELVGRTVEYADHLDIVKVGIDGITMMYPWGVSTEDLIASDWYHTSTAV